MELCAEHALVRMVNVKSKRCGHPGFSKGPSYGKEGTKKAEFCKQHAKDGMVSVNHKKLRT